MPPFELTLSFLIATSIFAFTPGPGIFYTNRQFSDRYACAQSLVLIEVIVCGLSMKALHASPAASTMAVSSLKMWFDRSFDRRDCQTFSTGFNSGDFDGSRMMVRFLATIRLPVMCHPARSMSPTACALCLCLPKCPLVHSSVRSAPRPGTKPRWPSCPGAVVARRCWKSPIQPDIARSRSPNRQSQTAHR